jgi:hypothetical protein
MEAAIAADGVANNIINPIIRGKPQALTWKAIVNPRHRQVLEVW